jgi:hypothetical protein
MRVGVKELGDMSDLRDSSIIELLSVAGLRLAKLVELLSRTAARSNGIVSRDRRSARRSARPGARLRMSIIVGALMIIREINIKEYVILGSKYLLTYWYEKLYLEYRIIF